MNTLFLIHSWLGERILPLLIVIAAIWFTVAWKPGVTNPAARLFPILIDIQAALGLIYWIYLIVAGGSGRALALSFPFLLHPIIGILLAGFSHTAMKPTGPFSRFGRWSALIALIVILIFVIINTTIAKSAP